MVGLALKFVLGAILLGVTWLSLNQQGRTDGPEHVLGDQALVLKALSAAQ
jgi:hypothetical protein